MYECYLFQSILCSNIILNIIKIHFYLFLFNVEQKNSAFNKCLSSSVIILLCIHKVFYEIKEIRELTFLYYLLPVIMIQADFGPHYQVEEIH